MRERVRLFNGEIQIDSNTTGTTISVTIPNKAAPLPPKRRSKIVGKHGSMRILVADDNSMVRTYITELLTDTPWRVCCEAADGSDALQKTRELKPDLVLLDVSMPGTNGLEIANIIRQELPAIKIVVASHHDLKQLLSSDAHQLADGFVDKDRMGLDLLPTITRALSKNGPNHRS